MNTLLLIVTIVSIGVAAAAAVMAWRVVQADRRRSDARVRALAADLSQTAGNPLFTVAGPEASPRSRAPIAVVAGGLIVGSVVVLALILSSGQEPAASALSNRSTMAGPDAAGPALELLSLTHERADGNFVVRGLVHNPQSGRTVNRLKAVVLFYDDAGNLVTTAESIVEPGSFPPDGRAYFSVNLHRDSPVERYRIGFRADNLPVAHVDRRNGA